MADIECQTWLASQAAADGHGAMGRVGTDEIVRSAVDPDRVPLI
jgi:hypothetical protein